MQSYLRCAGKGVKKKGVKSVAGNVLFLYTCGPPLSQEEEEMRKAMTGRLWKKRSDPDMYGHYFGGGIGHICMR